MQKGRYKKPENTVVNYRINHRITAPQVRLIGEDNKQIGVMSLGEALAQAQTAEVDLVEIAPKAVPPVVKVIDYKKFQYLEAKKLAQQKKLTKKTDTKEIRLKPFMADGDYQVRLKRIREFTTDGHQVRVTIVFHGRQLAHKEFGFQLFDRLIQDLGDQIKVDQVPKFIGRNVIGVVSPNKGGTKTT